MNAKEIIIEWLKDNDFDGLYNPDPDSECGCFLADLVPCECDPCYCRAGKKRMMDDGDWGVFEP